jgi:hypothetical protein
MVFLIRLIVKNIESPKNVITPKKVKENNEFECKEKLV